MAVLIGSAAVSAGLAVLLVVDGVRLHQIHERAAELSWQPAQHALAQATRTDTSSESARNDLATESEQLIAALTELGQQWHAIRERWILTWKIFGASLLLLLVAWNRAR